MADDQELASVLGSKFEGSELQVKDLGPQIGWRTVFFIEYVCYSAFHLPDRWYIDAGLFQVGPLLIHPLFYYFPKVWYGKAVEHSMLQKYVYAMVMLHFVKRELETLL